MSPNIFLGIRDAENVKRALGKTLNQLLITETFSLCDEINTGYKLYKKQNIKNFTENHYNVCMQYML